MQDLRTPTRFRAAEPIDQRIDDSRPQRRRLERPAVKKNDVRTRPVDRVRALSILPSLPKLAVFPRRRLFRRTVENPGAFEFEPGVAPRRQEMRQILSDRRVGRIRKRDFPNADAPSTWRRVERNPRKEPVEQNFLDVGPFDLDGEPAADQFRAAHRQNDAPTLPILRVFAVLRVRAQEKLLRFATFSQQQSAFASGKGRRTLLGKLLLKKMEKREVEVVAAENQVIADRDAIKANAAVFAILPISPIFRRIAPLKRVNQREVGRSAADVANQNLFARLDERRPIVFAPFEPSVKRRLRFLDKRDFRKPRQLRRPNRQLARRFVERRRNRQNDVLRFKRKLRKASVPSVANPPQKKRANLDRRPTEGARLRVGRPRQNLRRSVDAQMTKPRFRRRNERIGLRRPKIASERPDDADFPVDLGLFRREIATFRVCRLRRRVGVTAKKRRQRRPFLQNADRDRLRNRQNLQISLRSVEIDVRNGGVCRAQIDSNDKPNARDVRLRPRTRQRIAFHRLPFQIILMQKNATPTTRRR